MTGGELNSPAAPAPDPRAASRYLQEHGERAAWIMGSSRSGSTWLLRMLTDLEPVVGIDDPHIGHHLSVWRPLPLAWATSDERPSLTTLPAVKHEKPDYFFSDRYRETWMPALGELLRSRFGAQLAEQANLADEPFLVVKEPSSHPAEWLLEAMPGSRLIFLLRDGRDVVDSWLDAYREGSWAIPEGAFAAAEDRRLALVEWLSAVWAFRTRELTRVFARLSPERRILIRYENLLRNPERELARICAILGVEASARELERVVRNHEFSGVATADRGPLREIRSAKPGAWRENLGPRERRAMHEIMGEELLTFGYMSSSDPVTA